MIEVKLAEELVLAHSLKLFSEVVALENLQGRVLASPILALREQPPFNRVAMDGIAISFNSFDCKEKQSLLIEGIQRAGSPALKLNDLNNCLEVMTGAVLPLGADTVIPYEQITINEGRACFNPEIAIEKGQNIHFQGSDYLEGEVLLESGSKINSAGVAIIASQGAITAEVLSYPRLAIISTGDELVDPGNKCEAWQIFKSNAFALRAELRASGYPEEKMELFHLDDSREEVFENLKIILSDFDGLIISGGVSMGKYDFVQSVMADLGVKTQFYKIRQRPGKPMFFGTTDSGKVVFALPGNPVSSLVCLRRYVLPSLKHSFKQREDLLKVVLTKDVVFKKEFSLFKAVKISCDESGQILASPLESNGSGDFSSLGPSDGFIELPAEAKVHKAGSVFRFFPWSGGAL